MEVAKNIILGGVTSVTLHDPEKVELADLGSQVVYCPDDAATHPVKGDNPINGF